MKIGDKVKILKDIPSVNGMLHGGTVVKVDEIIEYANADPVRGNIRVVDNLGKIWWVNLTDISKRN